MFASVDRLENSGMAHVQNVVYQADKTLFVEFEHRPELQAYESEQAGRPIYKNVLYVIKRTAGDNKSSVIKRARMDADKFGPSDMDLYPHAWKAFQNQNECPVAGIPLAEWPLLTKADVLNLKARNIHTVEALAGLSDGQVQNIGMGGLQLREKARAYIGGDAEISRLVADNAKKEERIKALENMVGKLMESNAAKEKTEITGQSENPLKVVFNQTDGLSEDLQKSLNTPVVRRGRPPKNTNQGE